MSFQVSSICSATHWWVEMRFVGSRKIVRRIPIAAWAYTEKGMKAICFDSNDSFCAESDDDLVVEYKYGSGLKQIGDGLPPDDEMPKSTRKKLK